MLPISRREQTSVPIGNRHQQQHHRNLHQHPNNRGQGSPGIQTKQADCHRNRQLKNLEAPIMAPGAAIDRG